MKLASCTLAIFERRLPYASAGWSLVIAGVARVGLLVRCCVCETKVKLTVTKFFLRWLHVRRCPPSPMRNHEPSGHSSALAALGTLQPGPRVHDFPYIPRTQCITVIYIFILYVRPPPGGPALRANVAGQITRASTLYVFIHVYICIRMYIHGQS